MSNARALARQRQWSKLGHVVTADHEIGARRPLRTLLDLDRSAAAAFAAGRTPTSPGRARRSPLSNVLQRLSPGVVPSMDATSCYLNQLETAQRQLLVFARELNQLYHTERARAAELERALSRLEESYLDMVKTLAFVVEAKDPSTRAHLERTHDYATVLARMIDADLVEDQCLRYGFLLHDVGKIGVPEAILNKPGPLDEEEWLIMRSHPEIGVQMVVGIKSLGPAVEVIRCHHERWDGCGYPAGLGGEEIPLSARIFSVCDAFDAMTSDRPYRPAMPWERAVDEIRAGAGSQFDPVMAEAFMSIGNLEEIHASLHTPHAAVSNGHVGAGAGAASRATLGVDAGTR